MTNRPHSGWLSVAVVLAALYLLPLYAPPATTVGASASGIGTLFPGVPEAWILGRLGALAAAAIAFALAVRGRCGSVLDTERRDARDPLRPALVGGALVVAALLLAVGFAADHLERLGQSAFLLALPVPTLLVHLAYRRGRLGPPDPAALACLAVAVAWAVARGLAAAGDARAATPVDTWLNFEEFRAALTNGRNLLTDRFEPGASDLVHLLMGAPLVRSATNASLFEWIRGASLAWIVVSALLVQSLTKRIAGGPASLVATACLLASPAILWLPLNPAPLAVATAMVAALFLTFYEWELRGSPTALVALATLGGVSTAFGHTAAPAGLLGLWTAVSLVRRRGELSPRLLAVAVLAFPAAALPFLPDLDTLRQVQSQYLDRNLPWEPIEAILFGRASPFSLDDLAGRRDPGSIVLGALLSPVATARTALRLWGDVFLEPIGSLMALAAIVILAAGRTGKSGRILAGLLIVAMLPGFTSSYDRPSLIRMVGLPIAVPLLAALAFGHFVGTRGRRAGVAAVATAAAVLCSGIALFDRVNPAILAQSWVTVAIEACQVDRCVLLDYESPRPVAWLRVSSMASAVPASPIQVVGYRDAASVTTWPHTGDASVLVWSRALEDDAHVAATLSAHWPNRRLLELRDPAGNRIAVAADIRGDWRPELSADRWSRMTSITSGAR